MTREDDFERARIAVQREEGAAAFRSGQWAKAYWTEAKKDGWATARESAKGVKTDD